MNMEFHCRGGSIDGGLGIAGAGRRQFDRMLATASGRRGRRGGQGHSQGGNQRLPRRIGALA